MHRFCQHRWPAIAGMVGFRNKVGNAPLTGWVAPSSQQIAFARGMILALLSSSFRRLAHMECPWHHTGSLGFVAINNRDTAWKATFATGLPAGSYCNVIEGPSNMGTCSGTTYITSFSLYTLSYDVCGVSFFADSRSRIVAD